MHAYQINDDHMNVHQVELQKSLMSLEGKRLAAMVICPSVCSKLSLEVATCSNKQVIPT